MRHEHSAPQFGSIHNCPRCGMQVMDYVGPTFANCTHVVTWPGGARHRCVDPHPAVGNIDECLCGIVVSSTPDGARTDWNTGQPHRCGLDEKMTARPTPPRQPPAPRAQAQRQAQQAQQPPGPDNLPRGVIIL